MELTHLGTELTEKVANDCEQLQYRAVGQINQNDAMRFKRIN